MRTIRVSEEVWQEIAKHGTFGETEDDALRKVFKIRPTVERVRLMPTRAIPGNTLQERWKDRRLSLRFAKSGEEAYFELPVDRSDTVAIRAALDRALDFGRRNDASKGQLLAIRKAFTRHGYHLRVRLR